MPKQHFFLKLIPPRPTFAQDMSEEEKRLMAEHVRYLDEHLAAGRVLLFGPVMAAGGAFGMGVFAVEDEAEARRIIDGDPTVRAGLNRYELSPMRVSTARGQ
ncbi:MAG TPA: YciI family protein [Myxococcales bacterium]|nr:YciI family protein [Myxococcales bacterium]